MTLLDDMRLVNQVPARNLWIGGLVALGSHFGAALADAGITHVLTVMGQPLDLALFAPYSHMVVAVDDVEDENLLEHFEATNRFIGDALAAGGSVFVHCAMGISRSATVLAAYLMAAEGLDADAALDLIRRARAIIQPNPGFREQLDLYARMRCPPTAAALEDHPIYQRWLYARELELSLDANQAPSHIHFRDAEREMAELAGVGGDDTAGEVELRCKKCRTRLGTSRVLVPHLPKEPAARAQPCSHYFMEPLLWMKPELERGELEGRLECTKCRCKVGGYAWQGMRCSCGEWVVPGISLARGKVDEVKLRKQNVPQL